MLTFLLLALCTGAGAMAGDLGWNSPWIGAVIGFVIGLIIRFGAAAEGIADCAGDIDFSD